MKLYQLWITHDGEHWILFDTYTSQATATDRGVTAYRRRSVRGFAIVPIKAAYSALNAASPRV